jgi:DNA modification methylase
MARARIIHGDCIEALRELRANSIDACVTDPPYHLTSIVKRFGSPNAAPALSAAQRRFAKTGGADRMPGSDQYGRLSRGFMGQRWDGGDIAFRPETWREVWRVLKPGAYLLAFGGTRTFHRMACAIEDAGFEVRDTVMWLYGSGFPKSLDVSKALDRAAGVNGSLGDYRSPAHAIARKPGNDRMHEGFRRPWREDAAAEQRSLRQYIAGTADAVRWQGFGTALKPACEPIIIARKPLSESSVAANVLKWGTGALNIDACRIGSDTRSRSRSLGIKIPDNGSMSGGNYRRETCGQVTGRWPANVIHDGSDEVMRLFPAKAGACAPASGPTLRQGNTSVARGKFNGLIGDPAFHDDSGSAARFFYCAKASRAERAGSKHPTVKPQKLMRHLVRLIVPPGGSVLDCFAGSGSTGQAALAEGMRPVLIERERRYVRDIERRLRRSAA